MNVSVDAYSVGVPLTDADRLLESLDPEQRLVASSFGGPVVVIAGAGTGKTRAITHRIAYGAATGAYDPRGVLAVTFTTRAAGELRQRLLGLGVADVQARTFHSAALRQVRYFWPRAYGSELPPVSEDRLAIVSEAAHRLRLRPDVTTLRDLLSEISWAKVTNATPAAYPELAVRHGRTVPGLDAAQVGRVFGRYEHVKAEREVIDVDDILLCATALLGEHPDVAEEIRGAYRHLVVDEYQDVSPVQEALLGLWRGPSDDLCVVGDPAQTIHSFAGASPEYLTGFAGRHPSATLIRLARDYRSTPQVVALANRVAARARITGGVQLRSQLEEGPTPDIRSFGSDADEATAVAHWIAEVHGGGVAYREIAVLYRLHAQSPLVEAALTAAGIPFTVRGGPGFFDRKDVRQAMTALVRQAASAPGQPPGEACRAVVTRLGWTQAPPAGQGRARERWESWSALVALADDHAAAAPGAGSGDFVAEITDRSRNQHAPSADSVTLATLHAAKGLEWDAVALIGVQEGTLPLSLAAGPAQVAEEGRLLYVGVTRARRLLFITWARSRRGAGPSRRSRFLDGSDNAEARESPPRQTRVARGTALTAECRVCGRPLGTGAERKLRRHRECSPVVDPSGYASLARWRSEEASRRSVPPFCLFTDATLMAIAEQRPLDIAALVAIPGVGRVKAERYGPAVLAIVGLNEADGDGR